MGDLQLPYPRLGVSITLMCVYLYMSVLIISASFRHQLLRQVPLSKDEGKDSVDCSQALSSAVASAVAKRCTGNTPIPNRIEVFE